MREDKVINVNIENIVPNPNQPRKVFNEEAIDNLANSIRQFGIINPIIVRPINGKYEIVAGERRYRAAKKLNFQEVPVIIKKIDDSELPEISLIENLIRENLTPIEEANAYKEILNTTNLKESELASKIGSSQAAISNKLRLLSLPKEVQKALNNRQISERHARSLLQISDKDTQIKLLNQIIDEKLTVKELDNVIKTSLSNEDQINLTISNIMSSLEEESKIEKNNQKEEKESDNMNQGSFFPNLNQQTINNNNMSLNAMNMQSMNQTQEINSNVPNSVPIPEPNPSFAMPETLAPNPSVSSELSTMPEVSQPSMDVPPTPVVEPLFTMPSVPTQSPEPNITPSIEPQITPSNSVNSAMEPQSFMDQSPASDFSSITGPELTAAPNIEDLPLFNNIQPSSQEQESAPILNPEAPAYEIPVTVTSPEPAITPTNSLPQTPDKLTQAKEFLDSNNISYKLYSNETGHCIIIEL